MDGNKPGSREPDFEPRSKKQKQKSEKTNKEEIEGEEGIEGKSVTFEKKAICPKCGKEIYKGHLQRHMDSQSCKKEESPVRVTWYKIYKLLSCLTKFYSFIN